MDKKFYGKSYLYPTPNHGNRFIGVTRFSERDPVFVVGFIKQDGSVERVLSSSIPCEHDAEKLQARLDKRAAKLGLKPASGEIVVRECVEASAVLPPEPGADLPHTPKQLTDQYGRAMNGTLEVLRFGAMLADQDDALTKASGKAPNGRRGEESLRGYIEANCPTINYKTALGFKALAEDLRGYCKIPAKVPLSLAIPSADGTPDLPEDAPIPLPKLEKIQREVWGVMDGKSTRQLRLGFDAAGDAQRGGNRPKDKLNEEQKRELKLKSAKLWWDSAALDMSDQVTRLKSHMLLDEATLEAVLIKLDAVRASLAQAKAQGGTK